MAISEALLAPKGGTCIIVLDTPICFHDEVVLDTPIWFHDSSSFVISVLFLLSLALQCPSFLASSASSSGNFSRGFCQSIGSLLLEVV
ncbi:hypothetical protein CRG98_039563 [Punica granatum]|uniref:Uncharacterized protein n=1 Tax=Punica granatum TaxID=22663 RepID=A0A2I0I7R3_PUNGR|nr:hypothetical protein CRG98_039563 [Punica granatum]